MMKEFFNKLLDTNTTKSSKRFVTLLISAHFILASFVVLFFAFYVIIWSPRGKTDKDLLDVLKLVLEYDFFIILAGLGFVTGEGMVQMWVNRFNLSQFKTREQEYLEMNSGNSQFPYPQTREGEGVVTNNIKIENPNPELPMN